MSDRQYPLYHRELEHESCGVGAVADLNGKPTHRTVDQALCIVERLAHRAGSDAQGTTGDGVGIMTQIPHDLFAAWAREEGISPGKAGDYAVGMFFLPEDEVGTENTKRIFEQLAESEGIPVLGWREVPCHPAQLGANARRTMPCIRQCFLKRPQEVPAGQEFDRRLFILRRLFERQDTDAYVCSLSSRTIVYKGMMLVNQLRSFYDDLQDVRYTSSMAMVHSRFSTNTFPSWSKAHPHRMLLHNGEINTIRGNHDRMKAREETMRSEVMGPEMSRVLPVIDPEGSDSQMLDNTLEFLAMNGFPLPLAGMILLPEPWQKSRNETPWRDLYRYYATMMEPWDGPAAILYSDGDTVCASLDRNGRAFGKRRAEGPVCRGTPLRGMDEKAGAAGGSSRRGGAGGKNAGEDAHSALPGFSLYLGGPAGYSPPHGGEGNGAYRFHGSGHSPGSPVQNASLRLRLFPPAVCPGDQSAHRRAAGRG